MSGHVLAIDQGTTSTRAMAFDGDMRVAGAAQRELPQSYPQPGWVEHDPERIWRDTVETARAALDRAGAPGRAVAGIGIANQRETVVVWDRATGAPVHPAIVWQDRRTAPLCESLKARGLEPLFARRTGLLLDPYFSGTKIAWILDAVPHARRRAEAGELLFGTIDSWLVWRLTGGRVHATDATNASRTLLYDIDAGRWDGALFALLDIPADMAPEVRDCADDFGTTDPALFGAAIPILGVAGDQQAAAMGNACFAPGMLKATYGTGCFALLVTGAERAASAGRLLTTVAYRGGGETRYALEGSIFVAGAAVQWLRDGLGIIETAAESGALAERAGPESAVYMVPAFAGLGAPHWDAGARGAIFGLTRDSGPRDLARAALESVAFQTLDLLEAMRGDWAGGSAGGADGASAVLRADGGMAASDWTMQRLADILALPVDRPRVLETTALGAAWLAGSRAGVWPGAEGFAERWALDRRFRPAMAEDERRARIAGWRDAARRVLSDYKRD